MTITKFKKVVSEISDKTVSENGKELLSLYEAYISSTYEGFAPPVEDAMRFKTVTLYQLAKEEDKLFKQIDWDRNSIPEEARKTIFADKLFQIFRKSKEAETFSDSLIRLMRERKLSAPSLYKKAGIDAKHFSKIISNKDYHPKKETVLAFAIAFHLNLDETIELLNKAGFSFTPTSMFDLTVKFFIENKCYDRQTIDALMQDFDLPLLPQNWS